LYLGANIINMKNLLSILAILFLCSCGDDFENCQTCIGDTGTTNPIETEYCQDGANVISTVEGVVTTIENTTVEAVVASQLTLGNVTCN